MKKRNEMNPEFQWDFTHIYPTRDAWEAAYADADARIAAIEQVKGTLGASADSLLAGLKAIEGASEIAERVYIYAMLHKSADSGDAEYQTLEARAMSMLVRLGAAVSFMSPELLAIPEDTLNGYLADERLADYRHLVGDVARGRAHTLDAERERMLAMLSDVQTTPSDAYEMLTDVEMEFPDIVTADGKRLPLTRGNFNVHRESPDRSIREQAFENVFGTYKKFINTDAALYAGSVKMDEYLAKMRGFDSACAKSLFANNVPLSVYDNLIEAIHNSLPTMRKYLELRKKALDRPEHDMLDLYVPMIQDVEFHMPYEEGKALVKRALKPLGADYAALLDRSYAEKWMDVYENAGKRSGAFSCGVFGVHPYVLLNYTDTLDDAFTLAHELGHAMHSYHSDKTQPYVNHDYSLMVAEVASTVNEVLLAMYLMRTETDKKRRAYALNHFIEGFRTTVFRQTLFAEFERKAHDMYRDGTPLTAQALNALYRSLNEKYYDGIGINDITSVEWSYIPHFYRAYYVYQYATGFCSAVTIANRILETGDASGYLKFLTLGGSDYPIEELKVAGVDLTQPDAVASAMRVFDDSIEELAKLIDEL
ncbi:MAG: oligoendopeptidase F [Christensenellales bacterium]|jgi:oligoendopeptidase F